MDSSEVQSAQKRPLNDELCTAEVKKTKLIEDLNDSIECCPICLYPTEKRLLGRPEACSHRFCLGCIKRWSRRKRTCPICRAEYKMLVVHERYSRRSIKTLSLPIKMRSSKSKILLRRAARATEPSSTRASRLRSIFSIFDCLVVALFI